MNDTGNNATWPLCRWRTGEVDDAQAESLAQAVGVDVPLARCLVIRGIETAAEAEAFLDPRLSQCVMPDEMPGVAQAADIICSHIARKNTIVVFGDFDADGMTAASILAQAIEGIGGRAEIFIPDRKAEGYGFTSGALRRCLETHPDTKIIVTVDCGISQADACRDAVAAGVEVVITDHHQVTESTPAEASALVNPELGGTPEPLRHLCGAGVAFKLAHQLARKGLSAGDGRALVNKLLPLAAIGTVADLVPLIGENRIIVARGLALINAGGRDSNVGIAELKRTARVGKATSESVGFALATRINAAGRVGDPNTAVALLNAHSRADAARFAQQLERDNEERRSEEADAVDAAAELVDASFVEHPAAIVLFKPEWHPGVIGLVASRMVARYRVPSVIITTGEDDFARGSARCPEHEDLDLMPLLASCSHLLERHGGHRVAAGLTIAKDNIGSFRTAFTEVCAQAIKGLDLRPELVVDAWIGPGRLNENTEALLERLEPCGMKNPSPKLGVRGLTLRQDPRSFGKKRRDNWAMEFEETNMGGVLFRRESLPFKAGDKIDVVFAFSRDMFGTLQMMARDIAPSFKA